VERAIVVGCGYVGKAVAATWVQRGLDVTVTTTRVERLAELEAIAPHAIVLRADQPEALKEAIANQDTVLLSIGAPNRNAYEETYLNTAKSLVSIINETSVQQVIYTGSCAIYGDQSGQPVDEETAIAPITPQHQILAETENTLMNASRQGSAICILRLGGIYGPGRSLLRIFGRAAGTTRPGDGSEPSNWSHLDDIVEGIDFARTHRLNGRYNLVQPNPPSRRELIGQVCQMHNLPPVQWDSTQPGTRSYNAVVLNQKITGEGYTFIHKTFCAQDT